MPVRGLEIYLRDRKVIRTEPIASLNKCKIGIDGYAFLRKVFPNNEVFAAATGGIPLTLPEILKKELKKFEEAGIRPVFVFSSLLAIRKDRPFVIPDKRAANRVKGWDAYNSGKQELANKYWNNSVPVTQETVNFFVRVLHENGVEYFKAPYNALPQLAWMESVNQSYISGIYGGMEQLLFNTNRLIVSIDFMNGSFEWIDRKTVLRDCGLTDEEFVDACIFAGFDYCSTFPPLAETPPFSFKMAIDLMLNYKTGYAALSGYAQHPSVVNSSCIDDYLRARCIIKNHLILGSGGKCEPLNKQICPNDLHEIIGPRLPNCIYFWLSQGFISGQIVTNLLTGIVMESPPLCGGDYTEYRSLLEYLTVFRETTIGLLSQCGLNEYFEKKKIVLIRWFDSASESEVEHTKRGKRAIEQLKSIQFDHTRFVKETPENVTLTYVVKGQSGNKLINLNGKSQGATVNSTASLLLLSQFNTLLSMNYFTSDGKPTHYSKALELAKVFPEQTLVILEMIRSGFLSNLKFTPLGKTTEETSETEKNTLLISRVFSLIQLSLSGKPWTGEVDFDVLHFNSGVKAIYRTVRNLLEMSSLALAMNSENELPVKDYRTFPFSLPHYHEADLCMGLVVKGFLGMYSPKSNDFSQESLLKKFPVCTNLIGDLKKGYDFWSQCVFIAKYLKSTGEVKGDLYSQFEKADTFLSSALRESQLFPRSSWAHSNWAI